MKKREYAKRVSLAAVSALLMGAVQPQAVLAQQNMEAVEILSQPVEAEEALKIDIKPSIHVKEGEETNQKVVTVNKEDAIIRSNADSGLMIDQDGNLVGTALMTDWKSTEGTKQTILRLIVEYNGKIEEREVRVHVKRGPMRINIRPVEVVEGSPADQKKVISVNREKFRVQTDGAVKGLKIDDDGNLKGTPEGFDWAEGQTEQELEIKVTILSLGYGEDSMKESVRIKVKKEEPKKDEQPKKEEEPKKEEQPKKEEELKKEEPKKKQESSNSDGVSRSDSESFGRGSGGAGGSSSSKPAVAEPKKEEAVPPVTLPATQEKEVGKVESSSYITGYSDKTVRPNASITRAEVATMIAKLKNYTLDEAADSKFADVKDQWFSKYVNAVVREGLTKGYADGSFQPNREITRAEFVQMIMAISSPNTTEKTFNDVKGHWAEAAIKQAYANGIVSGYKDGSFKPDQKISRAEAVVILNKLFNKTAMTKEIQDIEFKDLKSDHWAYQDILAALGK